MKKNDGSAAAIKIAAPVASVKKKKNTFLFFAGNQGRLWS